MEPPKDWRKRLDSLGRKSSLARVALALECGESHVYEMRFYHEKFDGVVTSKLSGTAKRCFKGLPPEMARKKVLNNKPPSGWQKSIASIPSECRYLRNLMSLIPNCTNANVVQWRKNDPKFDEAYKKAINKTVAFNNPIPTRALRQLNPVAVRPRNPEIDDLVRELRDKKNQPPEPDENIRPEPIISIVHKTLKAHGPMTIDELRAHLSYLSPSSVTNAFYTLPKEMRVTTK